MNYFDNCMTHEQLEQEYRRLVMKMHPDRNPDNPNATAEFQEMQSQYEERKAELSGDYSKARKGRERREQEERERREREQREAGRRRVEQAVSQARLNKQKSHRELKAGDFIYARGVQWMNAFSAEEGCANDVLRMAIRQGVKDETVVKIEAVFDITDEQLLESYLSYATDGEIYGGWETLQEGDPQNGIPRAKRVAKVVMFRSEHYCIYGNPKGDQIITDYYLPHNYETIFSDHLHRISAGIERERKEAERLEAERKARIEAEQRPMIEEWREKLISMSRGLTATERQTVAMENMKRVLKGKFPGVKFAIKTDHYGQNTLTWEDGPTIQEVADVERLFDDDNCPTPWTEQFGKVLVWTRTRKMSTLTKARILQDLGQVTEAFREGAMSDEVEVSEWDWQMLHAMCGVNASDTEAHHCMSTMHADGRRTVTVMAAVRYVFQHTSYTKAKTTKRTKQAA